MWDSHLHCRFSADSSADLNDIANEAIRKGLDGICLTDHIDFDYPKLPEEPDFLIDWQLYFPALSVLHDSYPNLPIRVGVELGMQNTVPVIESNRRVSQMPEFDFVIGSLHVIDGEDPYYGRYFAGKTQSEAYERYFSCTLDNIRAFGEFDVLGHIDYLIRYYPGDEKLYKYADYADLLDEILKELISTGRGLEINSSGLRKGAGVTHPGAEVLKRYRELGGEILTIGSDAHMAKDVGADLGVCASLAKECGFDYYTVFAKRKAEFYKL